MSTEAPRKPEEPETQFDRLGQGLSTSRSAALPVKAAQFPFDLRLSLHYLSLKEVVD